MLRLNGTPLACLRINAILSRPTSLPSAGLRQLRSASHCACWLQTSSLGGVGSWVILTYSGMLAP